MSHKQALQYFIIVKPAGQVVNRRKQSWNDLYENFNEL